MTLFTLLLPQSTYEIASSGARCRGGGKSHRTGTRTADTNYLSNWSKCFQKCHLLKDQLISSCCSPNSSIENKTKLNKMLVVFRTIFCELCNRRFVRFVLSTVALRLRLILIMKTCWIPLKNWTFKSCEQTCDSFPSPNQICEP